MRFLKYSLFVVLSLAMISSLGAQVGQTGSIRGLVLDAQKAPLPGVTITVTSPRLMGKQSVVTGVDGTYKFPPILPPGVYTVLAEMQGFNSVRRDDVSVRVGTNVDVNVEMVQATLNQEVTVVAPSPVVDIVSTAINQNATIEVISRTGTSGPSPPRRPPEPAGPASTGKARRPTRSRSTASRPMPPTRIGRRIPWTWKRCRKSNS
jgi:hypothetical protein